MPVTLPLIAPAIWNVAVVIPIVRRFRPVVLLVLIRLVHRYQENGSDQLDIRNRLANSPLSTQTSSDKNGWKTKPCPQVYPLNKPVSDVGHAEPASGSQSTMASLYTSAPHTP